MSHSEELSKVRTGKRQGQFHSGQNRAAIARGKVAGVTLKEIDEDEGPTMEDDMERAKVHATLNKKGPNLQFSVIQTPATYQGKAFKILIDCGSTHSFISQKCARRLGIDTEPASRLLVELANGKELLST